MKRFFPFLILIMLAFLAPAISFAQVVPTCDFTAPTSACIDQEIHVIYTGNAPETAAYTWTFEDAQVLSGNGQGPYAIRFLSAGEKHITLAVEWESQTCSTTKPVVVVAPPQVFEMTGGGVYSPGGSGIEIGLSGSQTDIIYKLFRGAEYTGVHISGTGNPLSFGAFTVAGVYTAHTDGSPCDANMSGEAVITVNIPVNPPHLCLVSYDLPTEHNKLIWPAAEGAHLSHYNIYRETYQNNIFEKIAEVPSTGTALYDYIDLTSDPAVQSEKYKLSVSDSSGFESEKSASHKTIHLNISPGIAGFNLIWNAYEGFEYLSYFIHRQLPGQQWELIDSVASNVMSYTDLYVTAGLATYYIEVRRPEPCIGGMDNSTDEISRSNPTMSAPIGIKENSSSGFRVYPNPVTQEIQVLSGEATVGITELDIIRPDGGVVRSLFIHENHQSIDVNDLTPGIYFFRFRNSEGVCTIKVVKL